MAALSLKVDASKLHPNTMRVERRHGVFAEVNQKGDELVLHTHDSFVIESTKGVVWSKPAMAYAPAPMQQPAPPCTPPKAATVEYDQSAIRNLYNLLKEKSKKGAGDVDAKSILEVLKRAEVNK